MLAPAAAQQSQLVLTHIFGIGQMSCAYWLSLPTREHEGEDWILGYWSAVNAVNTANHLVGSHSDAEAIFGEIKKICGAEPSTKLASAVARVYDQFQNDGNQATRLQNRPLPNFAIKTHELRLHFK
jgi:hypothetical protein